MTLEIIIEILQEELNHHTKNGDKPDQDIVNIALTNGINKLSLLRDWSGELARIDSYDHTGFYDGTYVVDISKL